MKKSFLSDSLQQYLEDHSDRESEKLEKFRQRLSAQPDLPLQMMSTPYQGRFLSFLIRLLQPRHILEIGTFVGYASLCLAENAPGDAQVHTIEKDPRLYPFLKETFAQLGFEDKITLHMSDAQPTIENLDIMWDFVFVDADKKGYDTYYELILPRLSQGGVIVFDNMLWKGKVWEDTQDDRTAAIAALNDKIAHDERVSKILLPIDDGILMVCKK